MSANAFISYSHADEKALERLHKHLVMLHRDAKINAWTDHAILAGSNLGSTINENLNSSSVFIALLSPDYIASNYCYEKEFQHALKLAEQGKIRIVPIILEPCDWLSTPFREFLALPKDGMPISTWTNQNNAYLDVTTRLRQMLDSLSTSTSLATDRAAAFDNVLAARRPRIRQDFDSIQKIEFANQTYRVIKEYFKASCSEITGVGDQVRAQFEDMGPTAFTCSVVNRTRRNGGEAHITVQNAKGRRSFGDINYIYQPYHTETNSSNGSIRVDADDYSMFLKMDLSFSSGNREQKLSAEQAAEKLWVDFVRHAGIEYD